MAPRNTRQDDDDYYEADDRRSFHRGEGGPGFHLRAGNKRGDFEIDASHDGRSFAGGVRRDHDRRDDGRYERSVVARSEAPTVHTVNYSEIGRIRKQALADMLGDDEASRIANGDRGVPAGALVRRGDSYDRRDDYRAEYRDDRQTGAMQTYRNDREAEYDDRYGRSEFDDRRSRYTDDRESRVSRVSRRTGRDSKGAGDADGAVGEGDEVDQLKDDIRKEENKAIRAVKDHTDRDATGLGFAAAGALLGAFIAGKAGGEENKRAKQAAAALAGGALANVAGHHYRRKFDKTKQKVEDKIEDKIDKVGDKISRVEDKIDDAREDAANVIDPDHDNRSKAGSRKSRARN